MQGWVAQVVVAAVCGGKRAMVPFIQQGVLNGGYGCHFVVPFFGNLSPEFICCKSHICQIGMYFLFSCLACSLILETLHKTYLRERFCITPGVSLSTVLFDQPETWKRHSSQARGRIFDAVMCMPCYAELWFTRKYVKGMKRGRAMWKGENAQGEKSGAN